MSTFNMADLDGVKGHTGSRVVPDAGDYIVMISKAALENGKAAGKMNAVMEYTILSEGPFLGGIIKEWLAIVNPSEQAQNIARSKLRAIQIVSGSQNATAVDDLTGKTIIIRINKEPQQFVDGQGNMRTGYQNNVNNYMDMKRKDSDGKEVAAFVAQPAAAANAASGGGFASTRTASQTMGGATGAGGTRPDNDDEIPF